jgi:hypothetical protein
VGRLGVKRRWGIVVGRAGAPQGDGFLLAIAFHGREIAQSIFGGAERYRLKRARRAAPRSFHFKPVVTSLNVF